MATTPNLEAFMDRVRDQIATANGAGSFFFDLSVSDAVQWNVVQLPPPRDPTVYLTDWSIIQEQGRNLGAYLNRVTIGFVGIVSGESDAEQRTRRAARLLSDINIALQNNRHLFVAAATPERAVEDIVIRTMGGGYTDAFGAPGWAYCTGEIEGRYALASSAGV